ncbi:Putative pterin-4-alpha-carbinolamine dehydratase [Seminavis robusta]|uniref:4a-hydroxytetrahydrobiopterin dehydratase n=1 Tax=Seminavis robusta TaxID=568900 RepID=A0A9N8DI98_9STRA|nr:Putative pterin-4-alpha-carbinolamine dehydratase [Seminavis robusta]|eukprot:Sro142_g066030.1 Putative pterin-4-alpha-carbinolamine dehydratase (143) ;mRNA; r:5804-6232
MQCAAPNKKCEPCHSLDTSALLSREQVDQELQSKPSLALWKHETMEPNDVPFLCHRFTAKNFKAAMDALNDMGAIAEREQHHPDFHLTNYRDVQIDIYTHKVKGITKNDIALAEMISQEVKIEYSPKWLKSNPDAVASSKQQ